MQPTDLFLFAALAVMILLMFMSSRKRKKAAQALQDSVKVGVPVILFSGIVGTVVAAEDDRLIVETTPGTKIAVLKGAVRTVDLNAKPIVAEKPAADKPATAAKPAAKKPAAKTAAKPAAKPAAKKPAAKKPAAN
jgi:preprotein translocase subunit YajC